MADRAIEDAQKEGAECSVGKIEAAVKTYEIAAKYYTKTDAGSKRSGIQKSLIIARQLLAEPNN